MRHFCNGKVTHVQKKRRKYRVNPKKTATLPFGLIALFVVVKIHNNLMSKIKILWGPYWEINMPVLVFC